MPEGRAEQWRALSLSLSLLSSEVRRGSCDSEAGEQLKQPAQYKLEVDREDNPEAPCPCQKIRAKTIQATLVTALSFLFRKRNCAQTPPCDQLSHSSQYQLSSIELNGPKKKRFKYAFNNIHL